MRDADLLLTGFAPVIWGTTYLVTTEWLPQGYPLTTSLIRALPAGLLLLAFVRRLPRGIWILRVFILGGLNFSIFWWLIFVSAYRLPGGVAATLNALQPLFVIVLSRLLLGAPMRWSAVVATLGGVLGVALLILRPNATLDAIGIVAGLGGALAMALGTVLAKRWQPPVSALAFTAWQLVAGGLLLAPFALTVERRLPSPTLDNLVGFVWLGLFGAALSYVLWFRGLARLGPHVVSPLVLLSPVTAVLLGWFVVDQVLTPVQLVGIALVLLSVWQSQRVRSATAAANASGEIREPAGRAP
ncbi:MAG: EamA family transporter [Hyphomicrobiales bacterium]|nr:EamA family transporter [Hyphomicrobiales bacterium]